MGDGKAKPAYEFVDMATSGPGAVDTAFANQIAYCEAANAPVTARIVRGLGRLLKGSLDTAFLRRIRQWQGAPLADALPLRAAGALHALYLGGGESALTPVYTGGDADDVAILGDILARRDEDLLPWLDGPPQTNEAGRSSNFAAAMLWLAEQGLPPRFDCLEIGSSAGINLMMERYAYDLGGVQVGATDPVMHFAPAWEGKPPPANAIEIVSLKGCDVAPVDLTDPAQALRLKAYIWPEHAVRFERMEAAIAAARRKAPDLVGMNAADFVEAELARPQVNGTTRLLMHSIVWQYVPAEQQARVIAAMETAGAVATPDRPLAWVQVEANRTVHRHELRVRFWPGGEEQVLLALSHPHGAEINWLG